MEKKKENEMETVTIGFYRGSITVYIGGYIGVMEKKMETTI